jgi:hypothetical protein
VPQSTREPAQSPSAEMIVRAWRAFLKEAVPELIKERGFTDTLKALNKGRLRAPQMMTVNEGVVEELPCGKYDAALQTDKGPLVIRGAERTDRTSTDPQWSPVDTGHSSDAGARSGAMTAGDLVAELARAGEDPPTALLCAVELARFAAAERDALLPLLWRYILNHRNSNGREELVGVAAAIRKYIAIMPMGQMNQLAALLESGHRSTLSLDLEIEVAKMVYRNFEVHPPLVADPHPELAQRLWEMVQEYTNTRILLRDKFSAAASLAIEAIVAMRSPLAETAWRKVMACPYRWFTELVCDEIDELHEGWQSKDADAAAWLEQLRSTVLAAV